jgi:hypothetical protein
MSNIDLVIQFQDVCRHCDAEILPAYGPKSEHLKLNVKEGQERGNLAVSIGTGGKILNAAPVTPGQAAGMRAAGQTLYVDHALTCPRAEEWHKVGTNGKATRKFKARR